MIIAWGMFLISVLGLIGSLMVMKDEKDKDHEKGSIFFITWFIISLISAQYIWG